MPPNVLITGASGNLGGTVIAPLAKAELPPHGTIYALVRNNSQAENVRLYGLDLLNFDPYDGAAVEEHILSHEISIVYWLIDALNADAQPLFIKALAKVKKRTGAVGHFLHTSGAKIFSNMAGAPTDRPLLDNDPGLYDIQKAQKAVDANNVIIDLADQAGVRSYIFVPCIVYSEGQGFGNLISIQTVAIVKAAKALRSVYRVDDGRPSWPVSHVNDTASLNVEILRKLLGDECIGSGKNGYYLAASGHVAWDDLYDAMAKALAKRGVVEDATVVSAEDSIWQMMGVALGSPKELVRLQLGGNCSLTASHGEDWVGNLNILLDM